METFHLGLGWSDPININDLFIKTLIEESTLYRLKFIWIDTKNIKKYYTAIKNDKIKIKFFLDMASETFDPKNDFTKLVYLLKDKGTRIIDDPDVVKSAADKSITHFDLIKSNIRVPYTVVIRHWDPNFVLSKEEETKLGFPLVIKPSLGYGQKGVEIINKKQTLKQIAKARKYSPGDNFLLQEFIDPVEINGRPAWFRVYQIFGEIIPCWWNQITHEYHQVTLKEIAELKLMPLIRIASEIGRITKVDWFSCEIALDKKIRKFVTIDYMNDQCAIYPKSEHKDGVPDDLIIHIARRLTEKAARYSRGEYTLSHRAVWFPKIAVKDENI